MVVKKIGSRYQGLEELPEVLALLSCALLVAGDGGKA